MILSNDPIPKELGIKKGKRLFNAISNKDLSNMNDDDDIIDYFLTH
jgi:hypothetical protein